MNNLLLNPVGMAIPIWSLAQYYILRRLRILAIIKCCRICDTLKLVLASSFSIPAWSTAFASRLPAPSARAKRCMTTPTEWVRCGQQRKAEQRIQQFFMEGPRNVVYTHTCPTNCLSEGDRGVRFLDPTIESMSAKSQMVAPNGSTKSVMVWVFHVLSWRNCSPLLNISFLLTEPNLLHFLNCPSRCQWAPFCCPSLPWPDTWVLLRTAGQSQSATRSTRTSRRCRWVAWKAKLPGRIMLKVWLIVLLATLVGWTWKNIRNHVLLQCSLGTFSVANSAMTTTYSILR